MIQNKVLVIYNNYMRYFEEIQANEKQIYKQAWITKDKKTIGINIICTINSNSVYISVRNLTLLKWVMSKKSFGEGDSLKEHLDSFRIKYIH